MKDIGAHVGYTILWGRVSKVVRAGVQLCYYPAAPPFHVMGVLSGTRVVRVLCMVMVAPGCAFAWVCVGVAVECASTKRLMFPILPKRRYYALSVSVSINDLNMR